MITSEELEDSIESLTVSKKALTAFARRLAIVLKAEACTRGVTFHALNEPTVHVGHDGFDKIIQMVLTGRGEKWECKISDSLAYVPQTLGRSINVTALTDSEIAECARLWADQLAKVSKQVVFGNLYGPRAVELCEQYNDLEIAFRIIRAWDPNPSWYVLRIDAVFKDLSA